MCEECKLECDCSVCVYGKRERERERVREGANAILGVVAMTAFFTMPFVTISGVYNSSSNLRMAKSNSLRAVEFCIRVTSSILGRLLVRTCVPTALQQHAQGMQGRPSITMRWRGFLWALSVRSIVTHRRRGQRFSLV